MSTGNSEPRPRTLAGYLALPRPGDLSKAVILPLGFVLALAATGRPSGHDLARAAVVWFAVEYLAYQARYQWNDIRGFHSDQAHPDRDRRGRLPGPVTRARVHIAVSAATLWARVAMAVLLVVLLPGLHLAAVLLPAVVAVFAVAVVYETLRARAGVCVSADRPAPAVIALWVVSGAGYCVRGLTGVALGAATGISLTGALVAGSACWLSGMLFVTTRWAVESVPFARRRGARLVWHAERSQGRGHLLPLTRWIPQHAASVPVELERWRPLWSRSAWHAPWNLALAAALPLAGLSGVVLAGQHPSAPSVAAVAAVLAVVWLALVQRPRVGTGAAAAAMLIAVSFGVHTRLAAVLPALAVAGLYLICVHQCLADVGKAPERVRAAARAVFRVTVGTAAPVRRGATPAAAAASAPRVRLGEASTR